MNEQAEYSLIGSILLDNSILDEITLLPDHFQDLTNQNIYRAMLNIKKKGYPIDAASLKDELGETGYIFIGGRERLQELKDCVPSVHAFKSYEQMILNQWKINTVRATLASALNSELSSSKIQSLIQELNKIDEEGTQDEFNLAEHLQEMYTLISTPVPKERSGIPSGYTDIDNKTDGFQETDLVIVAARPSIGKTAFLINLALNAGLNVNAIPVIFSLEMSAKSLIKRSLSCLAEINGMKMKNPYVYTNDEEKEKWINKIGVLGETNFRIYDKPKQTVAEMRAKVRKIKQENPDKKIIVFIDYLTKIQPSKDYSGNFHAQYTEISGDLKALAKEMKCPVVCLAQLSRTVEQRKDKHPMMSDIRESGSIEQDADVIMLLYRDEYYNDPTPETKNVLEVEISKNRDGEVGMVYLRYKKEVNRIESLYHYHNKPGNK